MFALIADLGGQEWVIVSGSKEKCEGAREAIEKLVEFISPETSIHSVDSSTTMKTRVIGYREEIREVILSVVK